MGIPSITEVFGLSQKQTEILYNFEMLKVQADIKADKMPKDHDLKEKWLTNWKKEIAEFFQKSFVINWYEDDYKLFEEIKKEYDNQPNNLWYDLVLLEAEIFQPYVSAAKEFKGLKYKNNKWLEFVVSQQNLVGNDFLKQIKKVYQKSINQMRGTTKNIAIAALATTTLAALTAVGGALFAPGIAVALVGTDFTGLSGIALTNAALAYLGGGAIAVGGYGVAGGTAVIAGGGALLGLTAGTSVSASSIVVSNVLYQPNENLHQTAKIVVVVKTLLANKRKDIKLAQKVQNSLEDNIKLLQHSLIDLDGKEDKEKIKEIQKSITQMQRALKDITKFLSAYGLGVNKEEEGFSDF